MHKLAVKTRGNEVETEHFGYIFLLKASAQVDKQLNDEKSFWFRSCAKPFQAKICADTLQEDLSEEFLTITTSSQLSSPKQIETLERMLDKFAINEDELYCGLANIENKPRLKTKLNHNCAGKHIAMLKTHKINNFSSDYFAQESLLQAKVKTEIERLAKSTINKTALDGCGLATYFMSLKNMAVTYQEALKEEPYQQLFNACFKHLDVYSVPGKFEYELMQHYPIFAKSGADGLMTLAHLESKEVLVVKLLDGDKRVRDIATIELLEKLGWIKPNSLSVDNIIYTSQGLHAGEVTGLFDL